MHYSELYENSFMRQFGWNEPAIEAMQLDAGTYEIDVDKIVSLYQIKIEPSLEPHVQGGISGKTIYVNPLDKLPAIRFRKAHGLGHYILGHIDDGGAYREENENDADQFATHLLMPKKLITMFIHDYARKYGVQVIQNDASQMVHKAGIAMQVPEDRLRNRMKILGLLL